MAKEENVMVVPRRLFEELGAFQGFEPGAERYLQAFLSRENNYFMPRQKAENDPSHKQIIPYVVLRQAGRMLHYVRGKRSGESRLVAKGSIGIGGHMNDGDEGLFAMDRAAYFAAVEREVHEELALECAFEDRLIGLINDDSTDVGQVHLGVVHLFELQPGEVKARESAITQLEFLSFEELAARRASLETWSQIALDALAQP